MQSLSWPIGGRAGASCTFLFALLHRSSYERPRLVPFPDSFADYARGGASRTHERDSTDRSDPAIVAIINRASPATVHRPRGRNP